MSSRTAFARLIDQVREWGHNEDGVEAIILVGSYARGTQQSDSDIDLLILTSHKAAMVDRPTFFARFGAIEKLQIEYYGPVTAIRIWHDNGLEVEYGLADLSWIQKPLDPGTHYVLSGGYRIILDKGEYFLDLGIDPPVQL